MNLKKQMPKAGAALIISFLAILGPFVGTGHAEPGQLVAEGRQFLALGFATPDYGKILEADAKFSAALAESVNHPEANFFRALTQVLALAGGSEFNALLDGFGISGTGRNPFDWTADFPRNGAGDVILPGNSPTSGQVQDFLADTMLAVIQGALVNLNRLTDSFTTTLTIAETGADLDLEVDYGEVALLKSGLQALAFLLRIMDTYNLNIDIDLLAAADNATINSLLTDYPALLTLLNPSQLAAAKSALLAAIDAYLTASSFIRAETDPQANDLVTVDPEDLVEEAELRQNLVVVKDSLGGNPVALDAPVLLDPARFFDQPVSIRAYLPVFTDHDDLVACSFPDPTFNGILLNSSQDFLIASWGLDYNPVDFNRNCQVLDDAIRMLQVLTGLQPDLAAAGFNIDINGDARIGLHELVYALQSAIGLR